MTERRRERASSPSLAELTSVSIAWALGGCMRPPSFTCDQDSDCLRDGEHGVCEPAQHCSFRDDSCASGRRYARLSGEQGDQCVDGAGPDGGVDTSQAIDAAVDTSHETPADAPTGCPTGYVLLPGIAGHRYRVLAAAGWTNQRSICGNEPANVYLAIPDDAIELAALVALAGSAQWIGISDAAIEATFVTVLDQPATFLPWAADEPDNGGNQDCVRTGLAGGDTKIETAVCGGPLVAVCECTP